jgi:multimeric flavodoxin WrbA
MPTSESLPIEAGPDIGTYAGAFVKRGEATVVVMATGPVFHPWHDPHQSSCGTPYGASTIAGATGKLQPAPGDQAIAKVQGKRVAEAALALRSKE